MNAVDINLDLICQATWLEGHSLAQTVFTNLYLHSPYLVEDRCLKAFSILMLKLVDHIRDRVNRAGVFEEASLLSLKFTFKLFIDAILILFFMKLEMFICIQCLKCLL
jgi:hypothetical protein